MNLRPYIFRNCKIKIFVDENRNWISKKKIKNKNEIKFQVNADVKKKTKLLSKRNTGATSTAENSTNMDVGATMPNKNQSLNHYTTFRPTAVTTNYSTQSGPSRHQSQVSQKFTNKQKMSQIKWIWNILFELKSYLSKQQQQQQQAPPPSTAQTSMSDYVTTRSSAVAAIASTGVPKSASTSGKRDMLAVSLDTATTVAVGPSANSPSTSSSSNGSSSNKQEVVPQLHLGLDTRHRRLDPTVDMDLANRDAIGIGTGWLVRSDGSEELDYVPIANVNPDRKPVEFEGFVFI